MNNLLLRFIVFLIFIIFISCSKDEEKEINELPVTDTEIVYGSVTDFDGNTYVTVIIGDQEWMAENLKVTHMPNGVAIPLITDNTGWGNLPDNNTAKAYCYNNNNADNLEKYGALYTYAAAIVACPSGWHLPSSSEWAILETHISNNLNSEKIGDALKSTTGWGVNNNGNDDYGFKALPGGWRFAESGEFRDIGEVGKWASSTENNTVYVNYSTNYVYSRQVYTNSGWGKNTNEKSYGYSIRCIKN